jgi:hypothetical protein
VPFETVETTGLISGISVISSELSKEGRLRDGVCVEFWDATSLFMTPTFAEVCPNPEKTGEFGPKGDFWRTWYSWAGSDGEHLRVRTTDDMDWQLRTEASCCHPTREFSNQLLAR